MAATSGGLSTGAGDQGGFAEFARFLPVAAGGRLFAVRIDRVIGVVESATITPLPFSPPPFEGLVLAMGQVVPQISLASLFDLASPAGGVVVLISDSGGSVGLRVEHVHSMIQIEMNQVVPRAAGEETRPSLVMGRYSDGRATWDVLNLDHLTNDALPMTVAEAGAVMLATEAVAQKVDDDEEAVERQTEPYLMLEVSGEPYAVKVAHVLELLELSTLRSVPHAPAWIDGMIDLRGKPVLGLSLAALLNRPVTAQGRLGLMVAHATGTIALIAEQSRAIERFAPEQIHPLREPMAGITSYLVRSDDSIVAIIDPQAILEPVDQDLLNWMPMAGQEDAVAEALRPMEYHQFLTMRVGREFLAISLDRIHRLQASVQLTPIPDNGLGFDGLADVGDAVVPIVDLRRVLGQATAEAPGEAAPPCLLSMIEGGMAGLVVDQVLRIETVPESQIFETEDTPNLPVSHVLRLQDRLMSVVSLDRLLPPL